MVNGVVVNVGRIALSFVRTDGLCMRVWTKIDEKVAADEFFGTSFMDGYIRTIFQPNEKISIRIWSQWKLFPRRRQ